MKNLPILFVFAVLLSCTNKEVKISDWRGTDRSGIFDESNLLKSWPEDGPPEVWTIENLGSGFGSPVFTDDMFFITGEIDSMTLLYCFNLAGEKRWQTNLGKEWMKTYPGSRSAPVVAGALLYTVTGTGNLYCVNIDDGSVVWQKSFADDAQGIPTMHGFSEAPVIDGDRVFWVPGGAEINVAALNRFTGEMIWSNKGFSERSGYNQGKLIRLPVRNIFVTFTAYHMMGFDSESGEMLWSHEQDNLTPEKRVFGMGDTHSNSVLFDNGSIYYAAGDGNCGVKLDLSADGTEIKEVWRNPGFDSYMGGIIKIGDYLYGNANVRPELRSLNAITGQLTDSLKLGSGSLVAADNMLYFYSQRGELFLLSYDEGKMQKVSSFRITKGEKEHFAHPVINKGILYMRHGNYLMAYDIRKK